LGQPASKGSGFASAVTTLRKLLPPETLERVIAPLSAPTAELVRRPPLPVAWIDVSHFPELVASVRAHAFGSDEAKYEEWGRQAMLGDLRTIYKVFIRFLSPQFVIDRGTKLWQTYTREQGIVRSVADGETAALVMYEGLPATLVSPEFWAYQRGVLRGVMEATGMKHTTVTTIDGGVNATHARFRVSWT
jgi:hypothetical protein